jgi:hypothetical protein
MRFFRQPSLACLTRLLTACCGCLLIGGCSLPANVLPKNVLPSGLLHSRWAMEDPEYAEKYCDGAKKSDPLGKLKQASDARFQGGASGLLLSAGYTRRADDDNGMATLGIGGEAYLTSFLTGRTSLTGFGAGEDWFTGLDGGLRLQAPSRFAPFVGLGGYAGYARETVPAEDDWIDNDDDGFVDEYGEDKKRLSGIFTAIYPEAGAHFWWNPNVRLTTYGKYLVTTEGRKRDDWMIGGGIAFFTNPFSQRRKKKRPPIRASESTSQN